LLRYAEQRYTHSRLYAGEQTAIVVVGAAAPEAPVPSAPERQPE
jgi:hypothetical protein